jgi:hypothetical protein
MTVTPVVLSTAMLLLVGTTGLAAQEQATPWHARLGVAVHTGRLALAGGGEAFGVIDDALEPGSEGLHPTLTGGALRVALSPRWTAVVGTESGERTSASTSRVQPTGVTTPIEQTSRFTIRRSWYVGAEWRAWQVSADAAGGDGRLRLVLGAGVGTSAYRLRQWGDFVDADRLVQFSDDLRAAGRGTIGYGTAAADVGVVRGLALRGELRYQVGSAPMDEDFASFDRLDLGGTRFALGILVTPSRLLRGK